MRRRFRVQEPWEPWLGICLACCLLGATGCSSARSSAAAPLVVAVVPTATPGPPALLPGAVAESTVTPERPGEWQFTATGQRYALIEVLFDLGGSQGLAAELSTHLLDGDGRELARGTVYGGPLPYRLSYPLPSGGSYRLRVNSDSGAAGYYSILLTLSDTPWPDDPISTGLVVELPPEGFEGAGWPTPVSTFVAPGWVEFVWPSDTRYISGWTFHDPRNPGHIGLDIGTPLGSDIRATAPGVVVYADAAGGYGNLVILDHGSGWVTYYAHNTELYVAVGQTVHQAQTIAAAGTTGYSTGPHLHFEIRHRGIPVDPQAYLP